MQLVIRWGVNSVIIYGLQYVLPGYRVEEFGAAVMAAAVLAVVNVLVRPVVLLLTLPVNLMTLGLLTFIINAAMFALAARWVRGFELGGPLNALLGSLLFGLLSSLLNSAFRKRED